jgi:hypothetical protein
METHKKVMKMLLCDTFMCACNRAHASTNEVNMNLKNQSVIYWNKTRRIPASHISDSIRYHLIIASKGVNYKTLTWFALAISLYLQQELPCQNIDAYPTKRSKSTTLRISCSCWLKICTFNDSNSMGLIESELDK